MTDILETYSTSELMTAIESNMCEWFREMSLSAGGHFHQDAKTIRYVTGIPHFMFNGVMCAQLAKNEIEAGIDAALSQFQGLPMAWWTGPSTRPQALGKHLEARGFSHITDFPGMAVDLGALNEDIIIPKGLKVAPVEDENTMKAWTRIVFDSFKFPRSIEGPFLDLIGNQTHSYRRYIGFMDGKAVATSELFVGAGVAGIYNVATDREVRRQGIGTAITLAPLLEAFERGYRVAILKATRRGFRVYRRIGFEEYCQLGLYIRQGNPDQSRLSS
jgi:ribosomal protein S18 acetylase RimI-like enzyme